MMRCVLFLALLTMLSAAEPSATLVVAAGQACEQAEQAFRADNTRISEEHSALLTDIAQAMARLNAAREKLTATEIDNSLAKDQLDKRKQEQSREMAVAKQIVDLALASAKLTDSESQEMTTAPLSKKALAAITEVERRVNALPARLSLQRNDEPVIGRNGSIASVSVLRLGEARAIALGSNNVHRGILKQIDDKSAWQVIGPALPTTVLPLSGEAQLIPIDATGAATHESVKIHRSFATWLAAGRFFIWPIIVIFFAGLFLSANRFVSLLRQRVDRNRMLTLSNLLSENNVTEAYALVINGNTPLDRVLRSGMIALKNNREIRESAIEQALLSESEQLTRGLAAIAVFAGVAPLLGLLGTVTGMIDMFSVIAAQGSGNAKSLSGGISEALICTQAGMLAAIPLLLFHAFLKRMADKRLYLLEEAACDLPGLSAETSTADLHSDLSSKSPREAIS